MGFFNKIGKSIKHAVTKVGKGIGHAAKKVGKGIVRAAPAVSGVLGKVSELAQIGAPIAGAIFGPEATAALETVALVSGGLGRGAGAVGALAPKPKPEEETVTAPVAEPPNTTQPIQDVTF